MIKLVWLLVLVTGTVWYFGCAARLPTEGVPEPGTYRVPLRFGGWKRSYLVHVPRQYDPTRTYALVVVLHGAFSTARQMEQHSGFSTLADREGFIVVYPNGIGLFGWFQHWNSGHCCGRARRDNIDDVAFVATALEQVSQTLTVDRRRVYMVGNSNGGMLTYRFAAERSGLVAAIAAVSATVGGQPGDGDPAWRIPPPQLPVPVLALHGRTDEVVAYAGGLGKRRPGKRSDVSVAESVGLWVDRNGCDAEPVAERLRQGRVLRQTWSGGTCRAEVVLYTLEQWGHVWPGRHFTRKLEPGDTLLNFDAAAVVWEFFRRHRR